MGVQPPIGVADGPESAGIAGLLRGPVQGRSRATVAAAITAAVDLLDESGEAGVSVEAVRHRAGVATGSLYHHFGDVGSLIAVARAVRSQRSVEGPVRDAVARYEAASSPDELARVTRSQVVGRDVPDARRAVWDLTDAYAAARDRPALLEVVSATLRSNLDLLDAVFRAHRDAGRLPSELQPRAMILISRGLAHVRLLDDLDPQPVPHRDWVAVACRIHDGLVSPAPVGPPADAGGRRTAALAALIGPADLHEAPVAGDPRVIRTVARARDLLVAAGPDAVQVGRIRAEQGVSAGWFHRTFGDREGLLAAARLDLLERTMLAELRSFSALVDAARSPADLVDAAAVWAAAPTPGETVRRMRWQRADLLVSARSSSSLGFEAGRAISAATDGLAEVAVRAQTRGLLRPELAPRAIARVIQSLVFWPLLAEIDGTGVPPEAWVVATRRALLPLT